MDGVVAVRSATPFIGRGPHLERLHELLKGAAAGTSAAVLLSGEAGVGKTSLATGFGRQARETGAIVLTGRNVDLGSGGLPYLPFSEALTQVLREGRSDGVEPLIGPAARAKAARDVVLRIASVRPSLARLAGRNESLPEPHGGAADLDRLALFEAVSDTLSRISATVAPLVLIIEDLHWAEQSTRDLVRFLATRLASDPLLILVTYRSDDLHRRHPVRALLAELMRLPAVELMELNPFDEAELSAFLTAVHGSELSASIVHRIAERSAGNAFFAEELLSAEADDDRLPAALADVLIDRLERLQPATQQLLRVASVIGAFRIEDTLLRTAAAEGAGLSGPQAQAALRDAVAQQVLVPDEDDRFGFRHALLQEAMYEDLLPGERVRLHGTIARLLAERDTVPGRQAAGDAAEQARHALAAHDLPQALDASLRAARAAIERLAPAEALTQFERVLQLWTVVDGSARPAGTDVVSIGLAAADAAGDAGLRERAVALSQAAADAAHATGDTELSNQALARLAVHLYAIDDNDRVIKVTRQVVASYPGTQDGGQAQNPTAALVSARAMMARAMCSLSDTDGALRVVRPGLAEAGALGMRAAEADMQMSWAVVDYMLGRAGADEHLQLARDAAEASGDPGIMMRVVYSGLIDRFEEGDLDTVLRLIDESLAIADSAGLSNGLYATQCRWMLVNAHWNRGDADAAMAAVVDGCSSLPAFGSRQVQHAALPILAARDPREALSWAHDLEAVPTNPWDEPGRWAAKAEAYAWLGDLDRSVECSASAIATLDALGEPYALIGIAMSTSAVAVYADLAARAGQGRSAGHVAAAQRFVDDARERARHGKPRRFRMGPEGLAWLERLQAEERRLTGSDTSQDWQATVDAFARFGMAYELARSRWRLAQRLLAEGARDDARMQVAAARKAAVSLGAAPLLAALDDLARRGRLHSSAAPDGSRLTARECDVMRLVAKGLTNRAIGERLFISEKTASVHVSNVLTKLGASGRAEAVAIATRNGLLD